VQPQTRAPDETRPPDPSAAKADGRGAGNSRLRPIALIAAVAVLAAVVAGGVSLVVLQLQSRTNTQSVNLGSRVTINEDSAIIQAATRAKPGS